MNTHFQSGGGPPHSKALARTRNLTNESSGCEELFARADSRSELSGVTA